MSAKRYTICFDTICTGYSPIMTEIDVTKRKRMPTGGAVRTLDDGRKLWEGPVSYPTRKAAQAEIDGDPGFYSDPPCFVAEMSEIGHKTIFHGTK